MTQPRKTHSRATLVATLTLVLGIMASLAMNLQAINLSDRAPGVGAYVSAMWWPASLFLGIEILVHTPWQDMNRDRWTKAGVLFLVAAVAAWVSYWHGAHVLSAYGYDVASRYVGPLAVDALMVLATLALNRVGQARRADKLSAVVPAPIVWTDTPSVADLEDMFSLADFLPQPTGPAVPPPLPVPVSAPPAASAKVVRVLAPSEMDAAVEGLIMVGAESDLEIKRMVAEVYGVSTKTVGRRIETIRMAAEA
jgi:hypothetical protein